MLRKVLGAERSKHLPPIKRGSCADVYLTSSGQDQMVSFFITFSHNFFCTAREGKHFHPRMLSKKPKHHVIVLRTQKTPNINMFHVNLDSKNLKL